MRVDIRGRRKDKGDKLDKYFELLWTGDLKYLIPEVLEGFSEIWWGIEIVFKERMKYGEA